MDTDQAGIDKRDQPATPRRRQYAATAPINYDLHARLRHLSRRNKFLGLDSGLRCVSFAVLLILPMWLLHSVMQTLTPSFIEDIFYWLQQNAHSWNDYVKLARRKELAFSAAELIVMILSIALWLYLVLISSRAAIAAVSRGFQKHYRKTWANLLANTMPVLIADRTYWEPLAERLAPGSRKMWTLPPERSMIEQQLEFCARNEENFAALAADGGLANWTWSAKPQGLNICLTQGVYCGLGIVALMATASFYIVGCVPGMLLFFASLLAQRPLLLRARLAAYSDFFLDEPDRQRVNGWFCPLP